MEVSQSMVIEDAKNVWLPSLVISSKEANKNQKAASIHIPHNFLPCAKIQ